MMMVVVLMHDSDDDDDDDGDGDDDDADDDDGGGADDDTVTDDSDDRDDDDDEAMSARAPLWQPRRPRKGRNEGLWGIRITIIPYTPTSTIGQWAVTTYGREDADHVLHVGNNDAHYVYLSQAT